MAKIIISYNDVVDGIHDEIAIPVEKWNRIVDVVSKGETVSFGSDPVVFTIKREG